MDPSIFLTFKTISDCKGLLVATLLKNLACQFLLYGRHELLNMAATTAIFSVF
jgi:hypothetical protein